MTYQDSVKIELRLTCGACPEQYDAFMGDTQVGYLRLRHGHFTVEYPDAGGELIYEAYPKGDGDFYEDERNKYLSDALMAILKTLIDKKVIT